MHVRVPGAVARPIHPEAIPGKYGLLARDSPPQFQGDRESGGRKRVIERRNENEIEREDDGNPADSDIHDIDVCGWSASNAFFGIAWE